MFNPHPIRCPDAKCPGHCGSLPPGYHESAPGEAVTLTQTPACTVCGMVRPVPITIDPPGVL